MKKNQLLKTVRSVAVVLFHLFTKVNDNMVMFRSFGGNSYSDNPRMISEALHEMRPETLIVWSFKDIHKERPYLPNYVTVVNEHNSWLFLECIARTRVWVTNENLMQIPKRKNQIFIQTWHGDRAFKKVLFDVTPTKKEKYTEADSGYCDLALAGSDYGEMQYRSGFRYKGPIWKIGTPRNDRLVRHDKALITSLRKELNIPQDTMIMLYAPTLREANISNREKQDIQKIDINGTLNKLESKYKCRWICMIRSHPTVSGLSGVETSPRVIDMSAYEDMADLLLITDLLITDYSSSAGDFALLNRPLVLFQPDADEYQKNERALYFKLSDSPYLTAHSQEELEMIIDGMDEKLIKDNCQSILDFYKTNETGEAAKKVAEYIANNLNNGKRCYKEKVRRNDSSKKQ